MAASPSAPNRPRCLAEWSEPYATGIVLWRVWRDRPSLKVSPVLAFAAMPLLLLLLPVMLSLNWAYDLAFSLIACPLLMAGGLAYGGSNRIVRWIGQISFPLYAINLPILLWAKGLGLGAPIGVVCALGLASYLALRPANQPGKRPTPSPAGRIAV